MSTRPPALLALADGTIFHGVSIGAPVESVGEVVFNTSMSGYQEILTDPSYAAQLVTLTYPHIGNVGINPEDMESARVFAAGLVIRDLSMVASNFRSTQSLTACLEAAGVPGIAEIDTRTTKVRAARASAEVRSKATDLRHDRIRAAFAKLPKYVPMAEKIETLAENMACSKSTVSRALAGPKRKQKKP